MTIAIRPSAPAVPAGAAAPSFVVETDRPSCRVEVAADPILFNGANAGRRAPANFYASDALPVVRGRRTVPLPATAWRALRRFPALYFRAFGLGAAGSAPEVTVADADPFGAPFVAIGEARMRALRDSISAGLQWLRVDGNRLADEAGATVVLRGVNRSGLESAAPGALDPNGRPQARALPAVGLTPEEIAEIVRVWGANVIRVPVNQDWVLTRRDYVADLDRVVSWTAQAGAYTLLALRRLDDRRAFGATGLAPLPEENSVRMWRALAARYSRQPAVLFDLFSAPHEALENDGDFLFARPTTTQGWLHLWHAWVRRAESAIRRCHPRALVFVSGWDGGLDLRSFPVPMADGTPLPGAVYASHAYPGGTPERSAATTGDLDRWFAAPRLPRAQPVFAAEFGGGDGDVPWGQMLEQYLRGREVAVEGAWQGGAGWTAWSWWDAPRLVQHVEQTRPGPGGTTLSWHGVARDAGGLAQPTPFGALVRDATRPPPARWTPPAVPASAPVPEPRAPLTLADGVGAGLRNRTADVRAVQDRLVALRYLADADATRERPTGADGARVADADLGSTLAAIAAFQAEVEGAAAPDRKITPRGSTRAALDRALPKPLAADVAAVSAARAAVQQQVEVGVAVTARVGNVPAAQGNRPADVGAVQARLVSLGDLPADHTEAPAAGATAGIAPAALAATRAAIAAFQGSDGENVRWWRDRGVVTGDVTAQVVAPDDATHQLLRAIRSIVIRFPDGLSLAFRDHPRSPYTVNPAGVSVQGDIGPEALPVADYRGLGLTGLQAGALRKVSAREGNFDAINTYDQARVSFGMIQFAGGRGLPPMLALHKARRPAAFATALAAYGIDVEYRVDGGAVVDARIVVLDPAAGVYRRGVAAEEIVRDDPRLTAVLMRAGRDPEMQRTQIEAAIRDYLLPSLAADVTWDADVIDLLAAPGGSVAGARARALRASNAYAQLQQAGRIRERVASTSASLGTLLASEQGVGLLLDRAVQEGAGDGGYGVARLAGAVRWVADREGVLDVATVARHEAAVIAQVGDDLDADVRIAADLGDALGAARRLAAAARAAGATVAGALALPHAAAIRAGLSAAIAKVPSKSLVTRRAGGWVRRSDMEAELPVLRTRADFGVPPATPAELATQADALAVDIDRLRPPATNAANLLARVRRLLQSGLEAPR